MDLLKGYGSDSDSSASSDNNVAATPKQPTATSAATTLPAPAALSSTKPILKPAPPSKAKRGGKRILSLGAVLPPEIFDRLTRQSVEDGSSVSSGEGAGDGGGKKHKRRIDAKDGDEQTVKPSAAGVGGAGDRTELNSFLRELRSTPIQVTTKKTNDTSSSTKVAKNDGGQSKESGKLGFAFMNYTTSTTSKKKGSGVVDVHAVPSTMKQQMDGMESDVEDVTPTPKSAMAPPPPKSRAVAPSFARISSAAPVARSFNRNQQQQPLPAVPQPSSASAMPEYPTASDQYNPHSSAEPTYQNCTTAANNNPMIKSRKQKREEERALRSGQAFNDHSATAELNAPSPNEFAPTAHAAAIASRAARYRGAANISSEDDYNNGGEGGNNKRFGNIAMYDPKAGEDVKGVGVTAKHRSKHQINQLMASAISLEAHRASEAELARFGAGTGGSGGIGGRTDAKRKYGW